ncbi:tetratricopeptide repeat protein [Sorangium sp. So ce542]|uniref:tetratricopeptide repeat protein n=1 Tax=Sorangium sp. So ce542 TaxID=3133316 RepID=UPI003F63B83D
MVAKSTPVDVFISYAPTDARHRDELERRLAVLQRHGAIRAWHQGHVRAGEDKGRQTVGQLEAAEIIVLLISVDYLAADPYWNEMEQALSRHDAANAQVIPVLVEACDWDLAPFGRLKPLPSDGRPVTSWPSQSEAWADVARGIRLAVEERADARHHRHGRAPSARHKITARGAALHQLRAPPGDFTGRAEELARLRAKLGPGGAALVALTGQGGVGKTALALKLAQALAPDYPDAQIEIDLHGASREPLAAAAVMARVVRAFEPEAKLPENEDELGTLYRSILQDKRALLLLDDARDRKQIEPLLPPPGCLLIMTSRQHFTLAGLCAQRLGCLDAADAIALVRGVAPRIDEAAAAELAALCGYLPLALRTAAATLADQVALPTARYLERLRLTQERQQLVTAVLASSVELLEDPARALWLRLGVFSGSFEATAAARVGGLDEGAAVDLTSELVRRSLLEWDEATARYRMHDLAREYARSRLDAGDRGTVEARFAEHFLLVLREADSLYELGGESMMRGLALFEREWGNVDAAQAWASSHAAQDDASARLCAELPLAGRRCLALRQLPAERIRWHAAGVEAARRLGLRAEEAYHLGLLGSAYVEIGDLRRTIALSEQALSILVQLGDRRGEGEMLCNLGNAYARLGEAREAIRLHWRALTIFVDIGDRRGEASALSSLGGAHAALDDTEPAISFHERQLGIARELGDRRGEGNALSGLGSMYVLRGELDEAVALCERALRVFRALGDRSGEAEALGILGNAHAGLGDPLLAIEHYDRQMAIACEIGDREAEAASSWNIGIVYEALGNIPRAAGAMRNYVEYLRSIGHTALQQHEAHLNRLRARLGRSAR